MHCGSIEEGALARFTFTQDPGRGWRVTRAESLPTLSSPRGGERWSAMRQCRLGTVYQQ